MLIDAAHAEETRVVVVRGNRIEEFDYESAQRKQLKGNIYLAKVTRVEPSLQAAFVDYGGNRHGFLAGNPSRLLPDPGRRTGRRCCARRPTKPATALRRRQQLPTARLPSSPPSGQADRPCQRHRLPPDVPETSWDEAPSHPVSEGVEAVEETAEMRSVESVGSEDAGGGAAAAPAVRRLQDPGDAWRQVLLVQVVKEERGNKGAALTTYLSLAGRYCVLMPNTARGGGISRKITDSTDRRRLKEVARDIEVPEGMGLIVRTAGAQRTKRRSSAISTISSAFGRMSAT